MLRQIQNLDPPGVAARGLSESLAIQLRQLPAGTEWREAALTLVNGHLHLLASKNYAKLMATLGLGKHELQSVIDLILSLSPRPGAAVQSSAPEYVIPDVFVRKERGAWKVELNPDAAPRLRINSQYANLIRRADDSADNHTLKSHLQEARWFIKSLLNRSETLLKTATCIVERQRGFLEHGEEAMKPMVLADVAHTHRHARVDDLPGDHAKVHAHASRALRASSSTSSRATSIPPAARRRPRPRSARCSGG